MFSTLLLSLTASAHHSFPAQYDINQPVELSGTVTEVQWTNPHIFIMVDVVDDETGETVAIATILTMVKKLDQA